MRIATLFSGVGSPEQAAKRVYKNNHKLVFACEWDKYARESFKANYEIDDEHFYKDINDMSGLKYKNEVDILIGGSPCQDFSLAGLRAGIDGQKGILIYQYIRIIKEVEPPIFIYENVKGMLSDKKGKTIKDFVQAFREIGYFCHYEVLNTKDYGVPQNRERIFLVGFKDKEHYYNFSFASKIKLEKKLKDILENNVDEKYLLSEKILKGFISGNSVFKDRFEIRDINKYASCLDTREGGRRTNNFIYVNCGTKKGYDIANIGDSINLTFPNSLTRRGRVGKSVAQTLDCTCNQAVVQEFKIRKLTPRECFRLQDFPDSFKFIVSNSQLYKQAGNSISVNVMEMIFNQIELSRYKNTNGGLF